MRRFTAVIEKRERLSLSSVPAAEIWANCWVVWRGYIANAAAVERRLREQGQVLRSRREGEILAQAYRLWGWRLHEQVCGEFAVVIHDLRSRTVILAHDELGLQPLFYSATAERLLAASHLEDLVALTGGSDLDEDYIADYLAGGAQPGERTPFAPVRRLLPGESLLWRDGRLSRKRAWSFEQAKPLHYRYPVDYRDHLRELLKEAVAAAMPASGQVACELWGDIDSSTVLALAASAGRRNLQAVGLLYPRSERGDQRRWIEQLLQRYPMPLRAVHLDRCRPLSELPQGFEAEPSPALLDAVWLREYDALCRAAGLDVVLTGTGGDAVLLADGGVPVHLADRLARLQWRALWREATAWRRESAGEGAMLGWLWRQACAPLLAHLRGRAIRRPPAVPPWIDPAYDAAQRLRRRAARAACPRLRGVREAWYLQEVLRRAHGAALRHQRRAAACQFRHPLLYKPLVAFMQALPAAHGHQPDGERLLHRDAMAALLPATRVPRLDGVPPTGGFADGLRPGAEWRAWLTERPIIVERGYVDAARWQQAVEQARAGRAARPDAFLATATLEAWFRQLEAWQATAASASRPASDALVTSPRVSFTCVGFERMIPAARVVPRGDGDGRGRDGGGGG